VHLAVAPQSTGVSAISLTPGDWNLARSLRSMASRWCLRGWTEPCVSAKTRGRLLCAWSGRGGKAV